MNYALILAGGSGTRFWPLSRANEPKQFLNIGSPRPMLEEMLFKIRKLLPPANIHVAASSSHRIRVCKVCRRAGLPLGNILLEPQGRSTLAPIAYVSRKIFLSDPQAVIAVLPCDHFVKNEPKFLATLRKAMRLAKEGRIVVFGFRPSRPETGYGYICASKGGARNAGYLKISRFIEKPDLARAKRFIRDNRFFWNAGTFIFRAETMLSEIAKFQPGLSRSIDRMKDDNLTAGWKKLPGISIDYAVMEKTDKAVLIPADYGWLDLGSWQAAMALICKDARGNILRGKVVDIGSRDSLIWGDKKLIAAVGLKNMIVVDTPDALLVCPLDRTEDVRCAVAELKKRGLGGLA